MNAENADLGPLSWLSGMIDVFMADFEDRCGACGGTILPGEDVRATPRWFIHADDDCEMIARATLTATARQADEGA